jgi:hypothetical protein
MEEEQYIEFITNTLSQYKKYSDRLTSDTTEVHPQDVQYLLANYQSTKFGLLAETQKRLQYFRQLERQYNRWWNDKVSIARKELLSKMPAGKFPALKEYSIKAQEDAGEEYNEWQEKLGEAQDKYEFLKGLKSDWDSFQWIISMLNDNMKSELKSLLLDRDYKPTVPKVRLKKDN